MFTCFRYERARLQGSSRHIILAGIGLFLVSGHTPAETVNLAWSAPTEGPVPAGYLVYYGTSSHTYGSVINAGNVTTFAIDELAAGNTYYFAVTSYDDVGTQSGYSNEVNTTIPPPAISPGDTAGNANLPVRVGLLPTGVATLAASESVSLNDTWLTIRLSEVANLGKDADWWLVGLTPWGHWYSYVYPNYWVDVGTDLSHCSPAYQGPIMDISEVDLFDTAGMPSGYYVIYYGVDTNMNGILDYDKLSYATIALMVP